MTIGGVIETAAAVRDGELTARQCVEASLAAIGERNPALNAFVHVDAEGALAAADAIDDARSAGQPLGALAGVPFGVKDLEHCRGMPTTMGSRWFLGGEPVDHDEIHVERLRAAGAIPIGKTATPEYGNWAYTASPALGITRNPWNPERTPGGSSGGSAAAVSAGMVPFATASDGGGSIRGPAGMTGLVGLKSNYGRIPTFGVTHLAQNAVAGALTTNVADHAVLLDVMAGPDARDRTCLPAAGIRYAEAIESLAVAGLRSAWTPDLGFAIVDPEVSAVAGAAAERLVAAADLCLATPQIAFDDFVVPYTRMEGVDKFVGIDPSLWTERADELDPRSRGGWESTAAVTLPKLALVEAERRRIEQQTAALFDEVDVIMMPTSTLPPFGAAGPMPTEVAGQPVHGGMASVLQMFANLMNLPAISVPAGHTADGLPIGLQIVASRFREDVCLRLARIAEQTMPWPRHAP
ncbi:MAG: amidase [Ilumatobacteraceae bacterium]